MLELSQGNEYTLTYNVKNADGSAKDLSGSLQLKYELAQKKQSAPLIQFTLSDAELDITDAINGIITVNLKPIQLNQLEEGTHYHELWQVNAVGESTTLMAEKLTIYSKLIKE